jgi:putative transposase
VIDGLNAVVERHPRWGYWKCFRALRRRGHAWNHKRVHRVYCNLGLNQPRRAKRRLPARERIPLAVPECANQVWSIDFMHDALYSGKRFRTLNIVDDHNREALAIEIDTSLSSVRVTRVLERLRRERGLPQVIRLDNGPEFLGAAFVTYAEQHGIDIQYIQPGKPNQNAYVERFNRTYREEVLDLYLFSSLDEVREITHWWLIDYNEERTHDALGGVPPAEYVQAAGCV